jgi:hypothetical protein
MGKWQPFRFIFDKLAPKEFARVFGAEAWQTKAFLLSFAPDSGYVEAVLDIYEDEEFTELTTNYLGGVEGDAVDTKFIRRVEKYVREILGKAEKPYSSGLRKNMVISAKGRTEDGNEE